MATAAHSMTARFKFAVLAVVILSLLTYAAAEASMVRGFLAVTLAVAGWFFTESRPGRGLPRWAVGVILSLIVLWAAFSMWQLQAIRVSPFSGFLAAIIVLKCWDRRQPVDFAQILSISLFLDIGSMVNSVAFAVWGLMVLSVPAFVYSVILLQVYTATVQCRLTETHPTAHTTTGTPRRDLHAIAWTIILASLLISLAVFVTLPRGLGMSGLGALSRGRVSRFTDTVKLGQAGLISQSQSIVMEANVRADGIIEDLSGALGEIYLRGAVLDTYSRGAWRASNQPSLPVPLIPNVVSRLRDASFLGEHEPPPFARHATVEILTRASTQESRAAFSLWRPLSLSTPQPGLDAHLDARTGALTIAGDAGSIRYSVECEIAQPFSSGDWSRRVLPDQFARLYDTASSMLARAALDPNPLTRHVDQDLAAARAIESELKASGSYTLNILAPPSGVDPIEWFVLGDRTGHCEYFASALAALCRSAGIESRVIAGYLVSERNPANNAFVVRESNAHAWVEVRIGQDTWATLDATPTTTLADILQPKGRVLAAFDRWLDGLNTWWATGFVGFDQTTRQRLLTRGGFLGRWLTSISDYLSSLGSWGLGIVLGIATLLAGVIAWWLWRTMVRRLQGRRRRLAPAGHGPEARLYTRLLRLLERRGFMKESWDSAWSLTRRLGTTDQTLALEAGRVLDVCAKAWFGHGATRDDHALAEQALIRIDAMTSSPRGS
ncbi:MAG: transglutaminaseTgpA domain-containing protein [Phycisphaerales bacterium]